jgi:hypothetical protein
MLKRTSWLAPLLALLPAALAAPAAAQAPKPPERFVRVGAQTARAYNVPSTSGATVSELRPGSLLAVRGERAGFLEVETAEGFPVWIYGQYTKPGRSEGILEITGNSLNMRPSPSSDESSFPLAKKLYLGDSVRMVSRANPALPLAEDWVRIVSPPGTCAWVAAKDTQALAAGENGAALWRAAVQSAEAAQPAAQTAAKGAAAQPASAGAEGSGARAAAAQRAQAGPEARAMLAEAETRMAAVRAGEGDLQAARAAYEKVLDLAPATAEASAARAALEELDTREELERLKADIAAYDEQRQKDLEAARRELEELEARKDPLRSGRFQARGWLERAKRRDGTDSWIVRWAGEPTAEVVCTSGRYDLSVFADHEVGVVGSSAPGGAGRPKVIDAARIEVLSGRAAAR